MSFCLPKEFTDKFLGALKEGKIEPGRLIQMTSEQRHEYLGKIVGPENAKDVNALFESKLLLKNQQQGLINWAKKTAGLTESAKTDLISRINRLDRVLSAADEQSFLGDLAAKKLGTEVSFDEAKQVLDLAKKAETAKNSIDPNSPKNSPERLEYGAAKVEMQELVSDLKNANARKSLMDKTLDIFGVSKAVNAAFDNSFWGRQGFKAIFTNPVEWGTNFAKSFVDIKNQLGKKGTDNSVLNAIKADAYSRPNAINGNYSRMKLDIGIDNEEAYPTSLPEKVPVLGRLYKAGEVAYSGGAIRLRADIADRMIQAATDAGVDLTDKNQAESIGKLVNSLTGRGYLGRGESVAKGTNVILFSPKSLKSNFDFLTAHQLQKDVTPFVRVQAAKNLTKVAIGVAVILGTAKMLDPDSVELDPRSSDFGKIKVGNTRIDVTGGMASLMTLTARILAQSTKSSTSKTITPLGSGKFGAPTGGTVLGDFFQNKLSPALGVLNDLYFRGTDFQGNKPTALGELSNLFEPLPAKNIQELLTTPGATNAYLGSILDGLGFVTNTYAPKKK